MLDNNCQVPITQREEGLRKQTGVVTAYEGGGGLESNKPTTRKRLPLPIYSIPSDPKVGKQIFFVSPQITNTQILGLILQSQVRKFLTCAIPQIANPQICNELSANSKSAQFLGVTKSQNREFAWKKAMFLIQIRIRLPLIFSLPTQEYLRLRNAM
jgi:hypothetical protein